MWRGRLARRSCLGCYHLWVSFAQFPQRAPVITPETKRSAITLLASVLTVSAHPAVAQVSESQIDAIFTSLKSTNTPRTVVLVVRKRRTVFRRGSGVSDLRTRRRIREHTNFRP